MEYEWTDDGGLMGNKEPTMIYIIFKSINPATSIGVSNLKDEFKEATLSKFGNNCYFWRYLDWAI